MVIGLVRRETINFGYKDKANIHMLSQPAFSVGVFIMSFTGSVYRSVCARRAFRASVFMYEYEG